MRRKIRAIDAETGKRIEVDADAIQVGRVRNPSLPDALLARIRAIHERVRGVYDLTLEQFEISFMRDADAEGEVSLWERLVNAWERVGGAAPDLDPKMNLHTLLGYSMGALSEIEQAAPDIQRIIEIAEGK